MTSTGFQALAGRIPGERIATTVKTSDSSTFTTSETVVMSVTASLVAGRTYRIRFVGRWGSTVADDQVRSRMRRGSDASGPLEGFSGSLVYTSSGSGAGCDVIEAEFTASSSGSVTFVVTGQRTGGSGNCWLDAESGGPAFLYVDYIRG